MSTINIMAITPGEGWYAVIQEERKGSDKKVTTFDRVVGFVWIRDNGGLVRKGSSADNTYFEDNSNFKTYMHETEVRAAMSGASPKGSPIIQPTVMPILS